MFTKTKMVTLWFGFSRDEDTGCELSLWMIVGGEPTLNFTRFVFILTSRFQKKIGDVRMMLCDGWNRSQAMGSKLLSCTLITLTQILRVRILVEEQLELRNQTRQELLNDFTATAFHSANLFWTEAS
jgi:hypothetical protein